MPIGNGQAVAALQLVGQPDIVSFVVPYLLTAFVFLLATVTVYVLGNYGLLPLVDRLLRNQDFDPMVRSVVHSVARTAVWILAFAVGFTLAGFGSVLATLGIFAGALALALGFAARDLIGNVVAGVFILKDEPFEQGDRIKWNGYEGLVQDIDLRVSRVRSLDNELITVPNSDLVNNAVVNPVAHERLRREAEFGIGYDVDIERAREIIYSVVESHAEILTDPAPTIQVSELGDSAVTLRLRYWIPDPSVTDYVRVESEVVESVKQRFDADGIDMPYPHRSLEGALTVNGAIPDTHPSLTE